KGKQLSFYTVTGVASAGACTVSVRDASRATVARAGSRRLRSARLHFAAFSATVLDGLLVLPLVLVGVSPASTTRQRATPRTRSWLSSTAIGSFLWPILVVPTG